MKKLMTLITAVALGAFAWAADEPDGFNGNLQYSPAELQVGPTNIVGYADDATTTWTENQDAPLVHWWANDYTNHIESADYEQPAEVAEDTIGEETAKVLKIEADTANPMLRTFNRVKKESGVYNVYPQPIGTLGLFADTKIKLSASEEAPQDFTGKIAVWLHAVPAEEGVTEGFTNLMVTCGQLDKDTFAIAGATNIAIAVEGVTVKPEEWHQITIRSIREIKTGETIPGFVIYVDGKLAQAKAGDYVLPTGLTGKAAEFAGQNALFASASSDADTAQTLESVGIAGNGSLSYIDLTDGNAAPEFAVDPTFVTIAWNKGVTGFKVDGQTINVDEEAGETNIVIALPAVAKDIEVTPIFETNPEYKLVGFTLNETALPDDKGVAKFNVARFSTHTLAIEAVEARAGAKLYVDGDEVGIVKPYVKDAVAALADLSYSTAKIVLQLDETAITDFGDWSSLSGDITLDLNGKTIAVDAENTWIRTKSALWGELCMIDNAAMNLTITNSAAECGQLIGSEDVAILCNSAPAVFADANIKYNGKLFSTDDGEQIFGSVEICGGQFKPKAEQTATFNGELASGKVWADEADKDGFWAVVDYVPPTGTVIIITEGGATTNYVESIAKAVEDATAGDTIALLGNQVLAQWVGVDKDVTLDLNGFKVTAADPFAAGQDALFAVNRGGKLTITDGATGGEIDSGAVMCAIKLTQTKAKDYVDPAEYTADNKAILVVNGGTIKGFNYAIAGNGNAGRGNTEVTITGGTIMATAPDVNNAEKAACAIYNPQENSTLTITGGTISGYQSAVEVRAGTLSITGGSLTATAAAYSVVKNGNGPSGTGAALVISEHTTKKGITATVNAIENATLTGVKSVAIVNPQGNTDSEVAVTLGKATYTGDLEFSADAIATVTKTADCTLAAPEGYKWKDNELAKIEYATLTITQVDHCTVVVSNAENTAEIETGATFDKDDKVVINVYRTPAEGYELDGYEATVEITMTADYEATAAVKEKQADKPSPAPGSDVDVEEDPSEPGTFIVTPTGSSKNVVIENVKSGNVLKLDGSQVDSVMVDNADGVTFKVMNKSFDITGACEGLTANTFSTELDGTKSVQVGTETIKVEPEIATTDAAGKEVEPMVITDTTVTIQVKTIPGLTYQLVKKTELDGKDDWTAVGDPVDAQAARAGLTAAKTEDPASFYKIKVAK